jgi:hypothetical protein
MRMSPPESDRRNPFASLRRFVRERESAEHCDMCGLALPPEHQHLIEPATRRLLCACQACALLFEGRESGRYRRVPRRARALPDFRMTDAQWDALLIPIGLAFFFHSTPADRVVAFYPGPAGATESLLDLGGWQDLVHENPILAGMQPDVEALLVNRVGQAREYYLAPIDVCYKLVGIIRGSWRGLSGGSEVWESIGQFFAELQERS